MDLEDLSKYSFIAAVALAIIAGLVVGYMGYEGTDITEIDGYVLLAMLVLGLVVGTLTITVKEATPFLIAAVALVVVGMSRTVWEPLSAVHGLPAHWAAFILSYIAAFAGPTAVVEALQSIWKLAKEV